MFIFGWISLILTIGVSWIGYGAARRFVRERLRYVDAALSPAAPVIAGVVAMVALMPVVWLLHFLALGVSALAVGVSVGFGVRAGALDVKRGYLISPGN